MAAASCHPLLQILVAQQMFEARVCPAITMMRPVLGYLQKKDPADIFAEPVSAEDVSDSPLSSLFLCVCVWLSACTYVRTYCACCHLC